MLMRTRHLFFALVLAAAFAIWSEPSAADGPEDIDPETMKALQHACREQPFSMLVTISKIRDGRGVLVFDLFEDPANFLKHAGKLSRVRVPAERGETQACVPVPHEGTFALGMYHDKNSNLKFDKGFFGLPAEPYGTTNDPPMTFGPPSFAEAAVKVTGPLTPARIVEH